MIDFLRVALQERGASRVEIEVSIKHLEGITEPVKFAQWNRTLTLREQVLLGQMLRKDADAEKLISALLDGFRNQLAQQFAITPQEIEEFWQRFGLS